MIIEETQRNPAYLDEDGRVCQGVVEHGQHVGCGDHAGVVTPGGDQQPVVDLKGEKRLKSSTATEVISAVAGWCTASFH